MSNNKPYICMRCGMTYLESKKRMVCIQCGSKNKIVRILTEEV